MIELVDHLFRHQSGRMVASLTRIFGAGDIDLAEDVVQEALVTAMRRWPFHGVPDDPAAWLVRVARNKALDKLRRDEALHRIEPQLLAWADQAAQSTEPTGELDDELAMMFACCDERLPREARIALTLKTLCGFGVSEIARAFLAGETAIAQRLTRAKRRIREERIELTVPGDDALTARLDAVLEVIYLLGNEGYLSSGDGSPLRADLLDESIRLTEMLLQHEPTRRPQVHALAALLLFHRARMSGRLARDGGMILLEDQVRARWDGDLIAAGLRQLQAGQAAPSLSVYHIEAGIAASHATATSFETTDWPSILSLYDLLLAMKPSPVVALNRAVALAMVEGPEAGLRELEALAGHPSLARYHLFPATRGELLRRAGRTEEAADALRAALKLGGSEAERAVIRRRLEGIDIDRAPRPQG